MGENVSYFGEVADKYDALVAYDEKLLDGYVEEHGYSLGSMALASTAIAFMQFAKTFTDIGRLGNGILIEGGWRGVGKDALRAVNLVGSVGAVAGRAAGLLKVVQGTGNTCGVVSQTNALRLSGQRFLITVEELAKRAGLNMNTVASSGTGAAEYSKMMSAMKQMGVPAQELLPAGGGGTRTFESVIAALRGAGKGVVTFSVRSPGASMGHRLFAMIGRAGELIIQDPLNSKILSSVADIRQAFGQGAILNSTPVIFVSSSLLVHGSHLAQGLSELTITAKTLAVQVIPVVPVQAKDSQTAVEVLHVREAVAAKALPSPPHSKTHVVRHGDWLSKLAITYYGNMHKWPVIYEANRKTIGKNPNLIRPGQSLVIPPLPVHGKAAIAAHGR